MPSHEALKERVKQFWNQQSCDTQVARAEKFSRDYFEQIEAFRYFDQPFIHSFAQFTRYHGKKILEVGVGAGTDFIQWLRAGAEASGIDLTPEAIENVSHRIRVYGLRPPECIRIADAENLPFESNTFDLGYSFGVLHHSPDTRKAVDELIRVIRPGGELKIMLYNRRSIFVFNQWVKFALLKGKPWKSLHWVLWNHIESAGTKAYTRGELKKWLCQLGLTHLHIHTELTAADYLSAGALPPLSVFYRILLRLSGNQLGCHREDYVDRGSTPSMTTAVLHAWKDPHAMLFTGCRLGFFHCISGRKAKP